MSTATFAEALSSWQGAGLHPAAAVSAALLILYFLARLHKRRLTQKPALTYQPTELNNALLSRMPTLRALYKPLTFLTNGHIETIFAAKFRERRELHYRREYLLVPEGANTGTLHAC